MVQTDPPRRSRTEQGTPGHLLQQPGQLALHLSTGEAEYPDNFSEKQAQGNAQRNRVQKLVPTPEKLIQVLAKVKSGMMKKATSACKFCPLQTGGREKPSAR